MNHKLQLIFSIILISFSISAQNIVSLDINSMRQNNTVNITKNANFDLGNLDDIFDYDESSLARTAGVNPFIITLEFDTSFVFIQSNLLHTWGDGWWTLESAETLPDLDSAVGTYNLLTNQNSLQGWVWENLPFNPDTAKYVRMTIQKTTGDNKVHPTEWELHAYLNFNLDSAKIQAARDLVYLNNRIRYTFLGFDGDLAFNILSNVSWTSSNTTVATVDTLGWVTGHAKGTSLIIAQFGSFIDTMEVTVTNDPYQQDFTVCYIKRLPEIKYVANSSNPETEGWPTIGQNITWRAYVKNWATNSIQDIEYKWLLNGVEIDSGVVNFNASEFKPFDLNRNWSFKRDTIEFIIDTDKWHSEEQENNNTLEIYTDALAVNFYVEQDVYSYFKQNQYKLNRDRNCWEDWANYHIDRWNSFFPDAIYPASPNGVEDRLRIDSIIVVPNNFLPFSGGNSPSRQPNVNDSIADLTYGFPASLISDGLYDDKNHAYVTNPFYRQDSILYELGKARYLIDIFGFNVYDDTLGSAVNIKEYGDFISGTNMMPFLADTTVYFASIDGLMNQHYSYIDEYSAAALNLISGHRAVSGNYVSPANEGAFMNDLPNHNRFTFRDQNGYLITNADVKVFQSTYGLYGQYPKYFDSIPDLQFTTDQNGQIIMGKCPFASDGSIDGQSEGVMLIRLESAAMVRYTFFESMKFNLEYWQGNTDTADYSIISYMIPYSIEKIDKNSDNLKVFPNPVSNIANIVFELNKTGKASFRLLNVNGQIVKNFGNMNFQKGENFIQLPLNDINSGVYFLEFKSDSSQKLAKIIVAK
ncbi:MAG: T9SS type A sorting domain-containing protein [Saprospiraceae bacterium]|nr:T9SS type A sorting domain-containing protein [Saprospiraceae bacterium]